MKKLLVVLALILLAVSPLFAQTTPSLMINGYFWFETAYFQDATIGLEASRFRMNFSFVDGDFGAKTRLQYTLTDTVAPTLTYSWAWYNLFSGMVKVSVGKMSIGDYLMADATGYNGWMGAGFGDYSVYSDSGLRPTGILLQVMPIKALNIGLLFPLSTTASAAQSQMQDFDLNIKFAFEGIGTLYAGYWLEPTTQNIVYVGFALTMIEKLTAKVKYEMVNNADDFISVAFGYDMDKLGAYLDFTATLPETGDMTWKGYVAAKYTVDDVVEPWLYFVMQSDFAYEINPYVAFYLGKHEIDVGYVYSNGHFDGAATMFTYKFYVDYYIYF